ncbi:hypothetical protein KKB18_07360 [bacterium]|nr:hypothetical protein [bacterium]
MSIKEFELGKLRNGIYQFLKEIEERFYLNWVGLVDDINIVEIYKKNADLFTLAQIENVKALKPKNDEEERLYKRLLSLLIMTYAEQETKELIEKRLNLEATSSYKVNGQKIAYRSTEPKMANEPNRDIRIQIYNKMVGIKKEKITPIREEFIKVYFDLIHKLGFKNYIEMCSYLQERNFNKFADMMKGFIKRTDSLYEKYLRKYLKDFTKVSLEEAHITDLLILRRAEKYDRFFAKEKLISVFKNTMSAIGINVDEMKNIHLDTEERPKKIPRACVVAVDPPKDVRLTIYPMGGQDDYVAILHEGGHAVHFAHDLEDLEIEYKYLGDRGFTEGVAYLFQHLVLNPLWLEKYVDMKKDDEYLQLAYFQRLMAIRRLSMNSLYQFELFDKENLTGMPELYSEMLTKCQKIKVSPASYLDMDMDFYSAGYVRAMLFESQLHSYLEEQFGPEWFAKKETGDFLKEHYKYGRKYSAEEVLKFIDYGELSTEYFERELQRVLGK